MCIVRWAFMEAFLAKCAAELLDARSALGRACVGVSECRSVCLLRVVNYSIAVDCIPTTSPCTEIEYLVRKLVAGILEKTFMCSDQKHVA